VRSFIAFETAPKAPDPAERKRLTIEGWNPAWENKEHREGVLASFAPRAETASESFQIDDTSKDWLTYQVLPLSITNRFSGKPPVMLRLTKHFASPP
jgi:hypothetical protein